MTGDETSVKWLPDHGLWRDTRELMIRHFAEIARLAEGEIYVVDLHLDVDWEDDTRNAGIEVRWDTEAHLAERRRTWSPHPDLLTLDPLAAEELPWDWPMFFGGEDQYVLWRPAVDPAGHALVGDYAHTLGLWYTDAEFARAQEDPHFEDEIGERQGLLAEALRAGLPPVMLGLHHDGEIARIFGRPNPITFSAHDSHARAWEWGRDANPPALYERFGRVQERYWSPG